MNSGPAYINIKYDYSYLNTDGSYSNVSNVGYNIGSYLQLLKKDVVSISTTNYYKIANPINLAFRKPNGDCRTISTDPTD